MLPQVGAINPESRPGLKSFRVFVCLFFHICSSPHFDSRHARGLHSSVRCPGHIGGIPVTEHT